MGSGKALCILLTEDHEDTLEAVARMLRKNGHTVHAARSAEEARGLADAHRCDLLVGDIGLPGRSGIDLMRELRQRHNLRGIAVSGYAARNDVEAALAAGFEKHLSKPISFSDLLAAIDEMTR
jgi:CheY-like chemotaxis protein